jgi:hypothetical protein
MSLSAKLADPEKRAPLIDDCVTLVDSEVQKKSGLGGVVIKTGYKAVKGIKPGFIRNVINKLFDEWAAKLDPIWEEGVASGTPRKHFESQRSRVANALLSVTDSKAENAESGLVRSTYKKLRPSAEKHVEEAVPALGGLIEKHST